jgi:hypothetical protein
VYPEVACVKVGGTSAVETRDTPQERGLAPLLFPLMRDGNTYERVARLSSIVPGLHRRGADASDRARQR